MYRQDCWFECHQRGHTQQEIIAPELPLRGFSTGFQASAEEAGIGMLTNRSQEDMLANNEHRAGGTAHCYSLTSCHLHLLTRCYPQFSTKFFSRVLGVHDQSEV